MGISLFVLGGCADTHMYKSPKQDILDRDVFTFNIYKNAFAKDKDIRLRGKEEIEKLMDEHGYKDFTILNFKRVYNNWLEVSYWAYKVKFYASTQDPNTKKSWVAGYTLGSPPANMQYSYKGSDYIENECNERLSNYLGSPSNSEEFIQGCIYGYKAGMKR